MSQKRQLGEEGTSSDGTRRRGSSPSFRSSVLDGLNLQRLQHLVTSVVEPILHRVVSEEVGLALGKYMMDMERNDTLQSQSRNLLLKFSNAISHPLYTRTRVEGQGSIAIEVALVDASNEQVVSSGLGSFAKVEIVVLNGDFGSDGGENWRPEEFTRNIVTKWKGKEPLLKGNVILTLKDGKGLVGDVSFMDKSRKTRSGKFRLGARLKDNIDGIRVREAISEPFIVKSHPRESIKKHRPPSLSDEVWRLDNISKYGQFHKRLSGAGVNTVQDFLTLFFSEPKKLRHILMKMSAKGWGVTVQHARTCILDSTLYVYDGSTSPQTNGVVFNAVRQVMGRFKDGQYVSADKLSDAEKVHARELVFSALENREKVLTLGDEPSPNVPPSLPASNTDHQDLSSHNNLSFSSSDFMQPLWPIGGSPSFDGLSHNHLDLMDIGYDQPLSFLNQVSDILTNGMSCANEQLNYPDEMNSTAVIDNLTPCASVVPINKVRGRWDVLVSVLRWRFAIKRIMARKTPVWPVQQDDDDGAWMSDL